MISLPVSELEGLGDLDARGGEVTGVQVDSRRIVAGDLFVAVGAGRSFVEDARARGAAATLFPTDAFAALARIGGAVRDRTTARVVGITGSMGKTSTKDILGALAATAARTVAAEASYNNEVGVPLTLCRLEPDTEVCVLELSMRGFGQIAELCTFSRPEIGVVTAIAPAHVELVGDLDGVARAKHELVDALPVGGTAIVPPDFEVRRDDVQVVRFGAEGETPQVEYGFTARHQLRNALAAEAAMRALGLPLPSRVEVDFTQWRGEESELGGGGILINDAYNANPVSMRAALEHLAERAGGRRTVAVLGDMAELGARAPEYHREVGEAVHADVLVAIGPLARAYVETAPNGAERHWVATVEEGIALLPRVVRPGDAVLVKGSRAMGLEAVAESLA